MNRQAEIRVKLAGELEAARDQVELVPDTLAENPPNRRKSGETSRLLSILDQIEIGKGHE